MPSDNSRVGSIGNGFAFPEPKHLSGSTSTTGTGGGGFNPFAKPFVFGAKPAAVTLAPVPTEHTRTISKEATLNAAAMEFKPGGFAFQFTAPIPSFPVPDSRPFPVPLEYQSPFQLQGREKRQRTEFDEEEEEVVEGDAMNTFNFLPPVPAFPEPEPSRLARVATRRSGLPSSSTTKV